MLTTGIIVFLILLCATAAWTGYHTGLVSQLGALAGLVLGLVVCRAFGPQLAAQFTPAGASADSATSTAAITYVLLFIGVYMAVYFVASMLRSLLGKLHMGPADRMLGCVFRVCEWTLFLCILLSALDSLLPSMPLSDDAIVSRLIGVGKTVTGMVKSF